jgi:hypothetical protein
MTTFAQKSAYANFKALARGIGQPVVREEQILPDTSSPGVSITAVFGFQSYFDTTLLETAILEQAANQPIVDNEVAPQIQANIPGYTFGLHPSSQTPIAIQPLVGGQPASPQAIILRPGQIYRPHGRPWGKAGNFSGFRWGLPFGWLGGGMATLYVFPSPDADAAWPGNAEVIFHRQTMQIADPAALPANAPFNWPMRFPWPHAFRTAGTAAVDQTGAPTVAISEPTRVIWSLQLDALAAPAETRALIQASNDFDLDAAGLPIATPVRFVDYTWGTYAQFGAGNLGTAFPVFQAPPELVRIAADDGGVQLVDISVGGDLVGVFVDVVRYGKI